MLATTGLLNLLPVYYVLQCSCPCCCLTSVLGKRTVPFTGCILRLCCCLAIRRMHVLSGYSRVCPCMVVALTTVARAPPGSPTWINKKCN
jgi:hypothetical protein